MNGHHCNWPLVINSQPILLSPILLNPFLAPQSQEVLPSTRTVSLAGDFMFILKADKRLQGVHRSKVETTTLMNLVGLYIWRTVGPGSWNTPGPTQKLLRWGRPAIQYEDFEAGSCPVHSKWALVSDPVLIVHCKNLSMEAFPLVRAVNWKKHWPEYFALGTFMEDLEAVTAVLKWWLQQGKRLFTVMGASITFR